MDKIPFFEIGNAGGEDASLVEMMGNPILVMINLLYLCKGSIGGVDGIGSLRRSFYVGEGSVCFQENETSGKTTCSNVYFNHLLTCLMLFTESLIF